MDGSTKADAGGAPALKPLKSRRTDEKSAAGSSSLELGGGGVGGPAMVSVGYSSMVSFTLE